jgi:AraC family transcriptional regulator
MEPRIESIPARKLVGLTCSMSWVEDQTASLWRTFMPLRKQIAHPINDELIALQVYDARYSFDTFNPGSSFDYWAAIAVSEWENIPEELSTFVLPEGLYAVFTYKGIASQAGSFFAYIFTTWLPQSSYKLDHRPHFAIMGAAYKHNDPASEEELWIPIKPK